MEETTYKILRIYKDGHPSELLDSGLTLEEARKHCSDPETSSSKCTNKEGVERTEKMGHWMDVYEEEEEEKERRTILNLRSPLGIWTGPL